MDILQNIIEMYSDNEFLVIDGHDNAIIGVDEQSMRLIYSYTKIITNLMIDSGMADMEAIEFFALNIGCAYVGEKTPIICYDDMI